MFETDRQNRAGHPPTDIAWRLRNWVWYWLVKGITGKSDEALDTSYLPDTSSEGTRRRFFQRVRALGSDPTLPRADLNGQSVFEQVHGKDADPRLQIAREAFDSHLWQMLSNPARGAEDDHRYIAETIAARGWYRTQPEDRELGLQFIRDEPAFGLSEDRDHVYSTMLTHLESDASADNTALLAALFREALNGVALEQAILLRSSVRACTALWVRALKMPKDIGRLIERLVELRLVRNIWMTPTFPRGQYTSQRRYVQALIDAHLAEDPTIDNAGRSRDPIVLMSPRLAWLQAHREALRQEDVRLRTVKAEQCLRRAQQFDDGSATDQWIRENAMAVRAALPQEVPESPGYVKPPSRDMRYCLPVYPGHGVRSGDRVVPYLTDGVPDTIAGRRLAAEEMPLWRSGDPPPPLDASDWAMEERDGDTACRLVIPQRSATIGGAP